MKGGTWSEKAIERICRESEIPVFMDRTQQLFKQCPPNPVQRKIGDYPGNL
jgi:hypothetical protein